MFYRTGRCCVPTPEEEAEKEYEEQMKKKAAAGNDDNKQSENEDKEQMEGGDDLNPNENPKASGVRIPEGQSNADAATAQELDEDDENWNCCRWTKYLFFRFLIVVIVFTISLCIPNLNILLTISGALMGTLVNIWLPVFFYTRAYNGSDKNLKLEKPGEDGESDLNPQAGEGRYCVKVFAWIILVVGTIFGLWGLGYVIYELSEGGVAGDEV